MFNPFYFHDFHPSIKGGVTFKVTPNPDPSGVNPTADISYAVCSEKEANYSRRAGRAICDTRKHVVSNVPLYMVDAEMWVIVLQSRGSMEEDARKIVRRSTRYNPYSWVLRKFL